jgi:hypothetical protein
VAYPLAARAAHSESYAFLSTPAGDHEWSADRDVNQAIKSVATSMRRAVERYAAEIARLEGELPKLKAQAGVKFDKAEEWERKARRLAEVERTLTHREQQEEAPAAEEGGEDATARFRFTQRRDGADLV